MLGIEYEIKLNDTGRPCIELSSEYKDKAEDKFFSIELARYFLQSVYARRSSEFDQESSNAMDIGIRLLGQIGDEMAEILWNNMKNLGDIAFITECRYHIMVKTIEERDKLSDKGIIEGNKLFIKQEGLKVLVTNEMKIYELKGGITNENWCDVNENNLEENK